MEEALAEAILEAAKAGQWEVVAVLAQQLEDHRLLNAATVVMLPSKGQPPPRHVRRQLQNPKAPCRK